MRVCGRTAAALFDRAATSSGTAEAKKEALEAVGEVDGGVAGAEEEVDEAGVLHHAEDSSAHTEIKATRTSQS